MTPARELPGLPGARVAESTPYGLGSFIDQYLKPLLFWRSFELPEAGEAARRLFGRDLHEIQSEEDFWQIDAKSVFKEVSLNNFVLTDWFPRAPGVASSKRAEQFLRRFEHAPINDDPILGKYFTPQIKGSLVEDGGLGTIRLRPKKIDGDDSWYATALKGKECHRGIPLVIPDAVLTKSNVEWGDIVTITGEVRFMQDAGLDATASYVHHALPLIVFVRKLKGVKPNKRNPISISPIVLFDTAQTRYKDHQFAFVNCPSSETDSATDWLERYANKFEGRIVTNFDEQHPAFSDAPLSYQRLVAKTFDRTIIGEFHGTITAAHIEQVVDNSLTNLGDIHVGHNVDVSGGSANISIDSTNVTQAIQLSNSLDAPQKAQLDQLVASLNAELEKLKVSYAEEKEAIETALKTAVTSATKPQAERKKTILQVSAKGLKDAADLVKDIAPTVIATADLIAKFILGL